MTSDEMEQTVTALTTTVAAQDQTIKTLIDRIAALETATPASIDQDSGKVIVRAKAYLDKYAPEHETGLFVQGAAKPA